MRKTAATGGQKCGKILLVDDHKMGLAARRAVLEELGHQVTTAANGQAAYELLQAHSFDLLVTDWKMPKMDGLELIRQLRSESYAGPIVLISGFAEVVGLEEAKTGADAIIQKNANEVSLLLSTVKRLLNRKPARKMPARQVNTNVKARPKSKIS